MRRGPGRVIVLLAGLRAALTSARVRAVLALGILAVPVGVGTMAFWTDSVSVSGTSFTSGTLDLAVNDADSYATTSLSMSAMVPGSTSAEVLTVKNAGNVPLKYSLTGGLDGTGSAALAPDLTLTIRAGGTKSGTTCTGGTEIYNAPFTVVTTTPIITTAAARGPLAASGGADALCFQVTFSSSAASTQQGRTAAAVLTFLATSDLT